MFMCVKLNSLFDSKMKIYHLKWNLCSGLEVVSLEGFHRIIGLLVSPYICCLLVFRENYLFMCQCPKCQLEADDPDVTSEEGEDEDDMDDS